jgi:hypothetical protein
MKTLLALLFSSILVQAADMVGGANSPKPSPPQKLILDTVELAGDGFAVKVPTGEYTAPPGGAPNYSVPGPIVGFKGPDGVWRGHGYLETYPRLLKFRATPMPAKKGYTLQYEFEDQKSYQAQVYVADGVIQLTETSELGPRNLFVFDCYYGDWLPSTGFVLNRDLTKHAFLYLPCYYDKPEATLTNGGVAVVSADAAKKDVAGFWCREADNWRGADTMSFQIWQRRQLPGDPSSRHFLGPETKSDSTPNPRTAPLLGQSLYEGHVTLEFALGTGTRKLAFAVTGKGAAKATLPEPFKKLAEANR